MFIILHNLKKCKHYDIMNICTSFFRNYLNHITIAEIVDCSKKNKNMTSEEDAQ